MSAETPQEKIARLRSRRAYIARRIAAGANGEEYVEIVTELAWIERQLLTLED